MGEDQLPQAELIEKTRRQILQLTEEIKQLAAKGIGPKFYEGFVTRVVAALAATGAAVWTIGEDSELGLAQQVGMPDVCLPGDDPRRKRHMSLLREVASGDKGLLVAPHAVHDTNKEAANPTGTLLVMAPMKHRSRTVAVAEIFQRPGGSPSTQNGYLRFLEKICLIPGVAGQGPTSASGGQHDVKGEDQLPQAELIEKTKHQIRQLINEIRQLAGAGIGPEYYEGFVVRAVAATAARGVAVWTVEEDGELSLAQQVDIPQVCLPGNNQHMSLLREVASGDKGLLIAPRAVHDTNKEAANPTGTLLVVAPMKHRSRTVGVAEIFLRPDVPANSRKGYLKFLENICQIPDVVQPRQSQEIKKLKERTKTILQEHRQSQDGKSLSEQRKIEETKEIIRRLYGEIEELAGAGLPPKAFYEKFLSRLITAVGATGAAVWTVEADGQPNPACQIDMSDSPPNEHLEIVRRVISTGKGEISLSASSGEDVQSADPAGPLFLLAPIMSDDRVVAVVVVQRSTMDPNAKEGLLRFLTQVCSNAGFLFSVRSFNQVIQESADRRETLWNIVREGRRLVACDRLSLAIRNDSQLSIEEVSCEESFEPDSDTERLLDRLVNQAAERTEPFWYPETAEDMPTDTRALTRDYVAQSGVKAVAVIPLYYEAPSNETQVHPQDRGVLGALIVEQFSTGSFTQTTKRSAQIVCRAAGSFLADTTGRVGYLRESFSRALSSLCRFESLLMILSLAWIIALLWKPALCQLPEAFWGTVGIISLNLLWSVWRLVRKGQVLIALNLCQLPLFCLLNYQVYRAFGPDHYHFDVTPHALDWIQLTAVHMLRAIDLLDGLEAYRIDLQTIHPHSVLAGVLLVWMHLTVDLFLIAFVICWVGRIWRRLRKRFRREQPPESDWGVFLYCYCAFLAVCVVVIVVAFTRHWKSSDMVLWPLDNTLRTIDIGDMFQIFGWRLHQVPIGFWNATLAVAFRFCVGMIIAWSINGVRVNRLKGLGMSVEQLSEVVGEEFFTSISAMENLGRLGTAARRAAPALREKLESSNAWARGVAAETLVKIDPPKRIDSATLARLEHVPDESLRLRLLLALAHTVQPTEAVIPSLLAVVHQDNPLHREYAVQALGRLREPPRVVISVLIETLNSDYVFVKCKAARALGQIKTPPEVIVPELMRLMAIAWSVVSEYDEPSRLEELDVLEATIQAVEDIGPAASDAVQPLIEVWENGSEDLRTRAMAALMAMGTKAKDAAASIVSVFEREGKLCLCEQTVIALGRMGADADLVRPVLTALLTDQRVRIRRAAATGLGRLRPGDASILPSLLDALDDPDQIVRGFAARAVSVLGPAGAPAVSKLVRLVTDKVETGAIWTAALALGQIGPAASPAVPALIGLLDHQEHTIRGVSAISLGRIGPAAGEALEPLIRTLDDEHFIVRMNAAQNLPRVCPRSEERKMVSALIERLIADEDVLVRMDVAESLASVGSTKDLVESTVSRLLEEPDRHAQVPGAWTLGCLGKNDAARRIILLNEAFAHADGKVRIAAAEAISRLGWPDEGVPVLIKSLNNQEKYVRMAACSALEKLPDAAKSALSSLARVSNHDPDDDVRWHAKKAYHAISKATKDQTKDKSST